MKNVDFFKNTGFDIINIPCSPDLLYDEYSDNMISFENVNVIQTDWLAQIPLEMTSEEARNIDYCIVTDEDTDERTCYIVDHYEMTSNVCIFYLIFDPYNTMGGFEKGSGNVVIAGSANRLSVPLIHTNDGTFPTAEDNTFFTLDEPFQPSNRLINDSQTLNPDPYVPPIPPTPGSNMNSRVIYLTDIDAGSGTKYEEISSGAHTIKPCMFFNPAGYKFLKWINIDTQEEYAIGRQVILGDGETLTLQAVWQQINIAPYKDDVGYSYVIDISSSGASGQPMTWVYSKQSKSTTYQGFRIRVTGRVNLQTHPSIELLDINNNDLQACFSEIEDDIANMNLSQDQRNAIEADYETWKGQLSKFFDWQNAFITLNTAVNNVNRIQLWNIGRTYIDCPRSGNDSLESIVGIGVITYGTDKLFPWVGYPDVWNGASIQQEHDNYYRCHWVSERQSINNNFNVNTGNAMINFYKDEYYTDHRVYYSPEFITTNQLTYTIPTTAWPDDNRIISKWNTKSDGSGTDYNIGQVITLYVGQMLDLYPVWG